MYREPLILAFETASPKPSAAVLRGAEVVASWVGEKNISGSEQLLAQISRLLERQNLALAEIDILAASVGPGSFTGIRVGAATALGLKWGIGGVCRSVSLLEAMASAALSLLPRGKILALIAGGRNQVYRQLFDVSDAEIKIVSAPQIAGINDVGAEIKTLCGKANQELAIVIEKDFFKDFFSEIERYLMGNDKIKINFASDKKAALIGLTAYSQNRGNQLERGKPESNQLSPLYLRGVRIGV